MVQYATVPELKDYLAEPDLETRYDTRLGSVLTAASDKITDHCDRYFTREDTAGSPTATEKLYVADGGKRLHVRDFYSVTGLVVAVDYTDNGTQETTLTIDTDFVVGPTGQRAGYPYSYLDVVASTRNWPRSRRPTVSVTALWGWSATPELVKDVCLQIAGELFKRKDAPFGVAGFDDFAGAIRISPSQKAILANLAHLHRFPVLVG